MNDWLFDGRWGHPRPDHARRHWHDLCGPWRFAMDPKRTGQQKGFDRDPGLLRGEVNVPFPLESPLSGVARSPGLSAFWYGRRFAPPAHWQGKGRVLLRFGAVDFAARVFVNGAPVGQHEGGYTPFVFDVTGHLGSGAGTLCLVASDPPDPRQPRGKQSPVGHGVLVWYPPTSGIWQPVWLEQAGDVYIAQATPLTDAQTGVAQMTVTLAGATGRCRVSAVFTSPDGQTRHAALTVNKHGPEVRVTLPPVQFDPPALWSPQHPALYQVTLTVQGPGLADELHTYMAFRTIAVQGDRVMLNNGELFQQLALCQGYFDGGICTPPGGMADFRRDAAITRDLGFNGVRMHAKAEDPRFLCAADALGLLVWAEMPPALWPCAPQRRMVRQEWTELVRRDQHHPSVITWVPVNESWGANLVSFSATHRAFVEELYHLTKSLDPTRPVVDNSGFEHTRTDILDLHHYLYTPAQARAYYQSLKDPGFLVSDWRTQVFRPLVGMGVLSAYAPGYGWRGEPMIISEYGGWPYYPCLPALTGGLKAAFADYTLDIARAGHLRGYAYTQLYDTGQETNGLLTLAREPKIPADFIRGVNEEAARIYFAGPKAGG